MPFSGDPKLFKTWIKSVEKFALLERVTPDKLKLVAFSASTGAVSDLIHRYLTGEPNATWDELKNELAQRFAEITDSQHAFMLLRRVKHFLRDYFLSRNKPKASLRHSLSEFLLMVYICRQIKIKNNA